MVCPTVRRDHPRALASRLSTVQADKLFPIIREGGQNARVYLFH